MKKIEEEWKTIPEFPDYEISNFGRCRNKKGRILKQLYSFRKSSSGEKNKYISYEMYMESPGCTRRVRKNRSAGSLVAKAFVENPEGCKYIEYIDGDSSNIMFTNIKWVSYYNRNLDSSHEKSIQVNIADRGLQLEMLRRKIELAVCLEKALSEGKEQEFIYNDIKKICEEKVNRTFFGKPPYFKEEVVHEILNRLSDRIHRGGSIFSIEYHIKREALNIRGKYNKGRHEAAIFDERRELAL
jgi:hypothetical protein